MSSSTIRYNGFPTVVKQHQYMVPAVTVTATGILIASSVSPVLILILIERQR